jgi:predicted TIM-barrel fold metal-dependent hydrolase
MPEIIDAYAHVGLPRFQGAAGYWRRAAAAGVTRAVFSAFDASPDLGSLHALARSEPDRVRALGVPIGEGPERADSIRAQLRAGFSGIRLADRDLAASERGTLDAIGEADGIAVVCGASISEEAGAALLLSHLERHPSAIVIGGHFAAPRDPSALAGAVAELFRHPRFAVVFSRHGGFAPDSLEAWVTAALELTGWDRIMWGSESPVLHWRDETFASAIAWIDRLGPSHQQRAAFFADTAQRIFFGASPEFGELRLPADPWRTAPRQPAVLWANGLPLRQDLAGRLLQSWDASPTPATTLGAHLERLLDDALPTLPAASGGSVDTSQQSN